MSSGAFRLPASWRWATFGETAAVASNLVDPIDYPAMAHIAPNHIESGTGRLLPYATIAEDGVTSPKHLFRANQILYSKIRPNLAKAVHVDFSGLCSADMYPIDTSLNPRYLLRWMLSPSFTTAAIRHQGRNLLPKINVRELASLPVPVPPLAEQERLAKVLDQADELQAKRQQTILHLDELARSIFIDMFEYSNDMNRAPLGNVLTFVTSGGRGWARYYSNSGARFIRSLDVQMNKILSDSAVFVNAPDNAEAKRTKVATGDVLLTITGSLIGRVAPVTPDLNGSYISQHVSILRPDQHVILPEFLSFFLSLPSGGQRQIARAQYGQTKPGLNFKQIRDFEIPIPDFGLQREFVNRLKSLVSLGSDQDTQLAELDSLFTSLQARAFSGGL
jgi:type I restriction enzyme S subunit